MTAMKKAAAGAVTPTTARGINQAVDTSFDYNTACHVWQVMCELLGQQEGVKLIPRVIKRNEVHVG